MSRINCISHQDGRNCCKIQAQRVCRKFTKLLRGCRVFPMKDKMKMLIVWILWCVLFVLCWPVALLALTLIPLLWLVSLPLRLVGITFGALFAFLRAVLYLPARILGAPRAIAGRPQP